MRVAILDDIHHAYEGTVGVRRLRERAEVQIFTEPFREPSKIANFDALVANRERTRFSRALLEQLPNLRIIAQTGNHVYHIDLEVTEERGIIVAKATGGGCTSAAELAIGLMIAVMRQIPAVDEQVKRGGWPTPMTRMLRGKTLGIVDLGYVGRHVSKIANAFEMKVLAWGPRLAAQAAASVGAESCELDALMARSDIVSIHATLSADSRGLIDARRLGLMRSSAYVINTARGPIIEEVASCSRQQSDCGRRLGRVRRRTSAARPSADQIAKRCPDLPPWLADRRNVFKICRCRRGRPSGLFRWARCSSIRRPSLMPRSVR
jgi:phosphoglycerate dehydrogenase-like enzyme